MRDARVNAPDDTLLRAIWQQIRQRNDWRLADDEASFFALVSGEWRTLQGDLSASARARQALTRAYSLLLHHGLQQRRERAAHELWLACYRLSLRRGWSRVQSEDIAQETVLRVLDKLGSLHAPQSLLAWSLRILRTVQREYGEQNERANRVIPLDRPPDAGLPALSEPVDMAAEIVDDVAGHMLVDLLRMKLANPLERLVIERLIVWGDRPQDIAHTLGIPLHRTRLAKHRALNRLRADPAVMRQLHALAGGDDERANEIGANDA